MLGGAGAAKSASPRGSCDDHEGSRAGAVSSGGGADAPVEGDGRRSHSSAARSPCHRTAPESSPNRVGTSCTSTAWPNQAPGNPPKRRRPSPLSVDAGDADDGTTDLVRGYFDRWVARQRTPADDRLDEWRALGRLLPEGTSCDREAAWAG